MGTRNLTMVISKEGEIKIAQYGQWDGYPSGAGAKLLQFCQNKDRLEKLEKKLPVISFNTPERKAEMNKALQKITGKNDGWMTMEQAVKFHELYPYENRDIGSEIVYKVIEDPNPVILENSANFAKDSLFCEWAYVINLQTRELEVYKGFNKSAPVKDERFAKVGDEPTDRNKQYYPVRLIGTHSFDNLPVVEEFIKQYENQEE